ncbi:hypothetical protein ACPZ19_49745 [Amycolatopsis lurida]
MLSNSATAHGTVAVLDGTGGVGKTSLVSHWAHRVQDQFPDGTLFVNLRGYGPSAPLDLSVVLAGVVPGGVGRRCAGAARGVAVPSGLGAVHAACVHRVRHVGRFDAAGAAGPWAGGRGARAGRGRARPCVDAPGAGGTRAARVRTGGVRDGRGSLAALARHVGRLNAAQQAFTATLCTRPEML